MAQIAFIGLGTMGAPMARNLLKHGHSVAAFDCSEAALVRFGETRARIAASPLDAAKGAQFVITMLPTSADVREAMAGPEGAIPSMAPGCMLIDSTTASPRESMSLARLLGERGCRMIDAAVGRPPWDAEQGTLLFLVGADEGDLAHAAPILRCMGNEIIHCGPQGNGAKVKAINNYMSVLGMVVAAETLAFGKTAGIDRDLLVSVLQKTVAGRGAINVLYPKKVLAGDVTPLFAMRLAHKDLGLAVEFGAELGVPLATGSAARAVLTLGEPLGRMDQDVTSLLLVLEEILGSRTAARAAPAGSPPS